MTRATLTRSSQYSNTSVFGGDFSRLVLTVTLEVRKAIGAVLCSAVQGSARARVRLEPEGETRFEPPVEIFPPSETAATPALLEVKIETDPVFSLKV